MSTNRWNDFLGSNLRLGSGRDLRLAAWILCALLTGFLAYVSRVHEITHDVFHEMSLFREAMVLGDFPQNDVFAYTDRVSPSVHHEWATGAILYWATVGSGFGLAGLALLKFALIAALWLLLYRVARMRGAHPYIFALVAFFCFPVFWVGFATVRAQLFTMVAIAAQLWMQEQDWRGRRAWIVLWLAMMVAWLNIHAGFVVGLGLMAFHGLERLGFTWWKTRSIGKSLSATWHLIIAAPVVAASTLINPYGWQYIPYLMRAIAMERPLIREWLPLWHTHDPVGTIAMFAIALALFAYAIRNNPWRRARGAAFLLLAAYMTLKHIRHGSIFGVIWLAYVPAWLSRTAMGKNLVAWIDGHREGFIRVSQGLSAACLLFACYHHFWRPTLPPQPLYSSASYPSDAVAYLKAQNFEGNLMTPFHVGAYISWEMYPEVQVSFDGRYEVAYQPHMMHDHNRFYDAEEGWWKILDKYPTDAVMIHKQADVCGYLDEVIDGRVDTNRAWRKVYEDDAFLVLAHENIALQSVDRTGKIIEDAAALAFTTDHAHRYRMPPTGLADASGK
ncbi:MAG: hypothetical protein AAF483_03330 [Planctomycetota bacterium]